MKMALKTPSRMVCCSTAAGPAFEGAGISAGSSAKSGAINTVAFRDGKITYTTIDDAPAKSLCGSGLIDAIAAFLDAGLISPSGRIPKEYGLVIGSGLKKDKFFDENSALPIAKPEKSWYNGQAVKNANSR